MVEQMIRSAIDSIEAKLNATIEDLLNNKSLAERLMEMSKLEGIEKVDQWALLIHEVSCKALGIESSRAIYEAAKMKLAGQKRLLDCEVSEMAAKVVAAIKEGEMFQEMYIASLKYGGELEQQAVLNFVKTRLSDSEVSIDTLRNILDGDLTPWKLWMGGNPSTPHERLRANLSRNIRYIEEREIAETLVTIMIMKGMEDPAQLQGDDYVLALGMIDNIQDALDLLTSEDVASIGLVTKRQRPCDVTSPVDVATSSGEVVATIETEGLHNSFRGDEYLKSHKGLVVHATNKPFFLVNAGTELCVSTPTRMINWDDRRYLVVFQYDGVMFDEDIFSVPQFIGYRTPTGLGDTTTNDEGWVDWQVPVVAVIKLPDNRLEVKEILAKLENGIIPEEYCINRYEGCDANILITTVGKDEEAAKAFDAIFTKDSEALIIGGKARAAVAKLVLDKDIAVNDIDFTIIAAKGQVPFVVTDEDIENNAPHESVQHFFATADFTINQVAIMSDGTVIASSQAIEDWKAGVLRKANDRPWTGRELARAIRFSLEYGLKPAEDLSQVFREAILRDKDSYLEFITIAKRYAKMDGYEAMVNSLSSITFQSMLQLVK